MGRYHGHGGLSVFDSVFRFLELGHGGRRQADRSNGQYKRGKRFHGDS
jgi:hypothetical protein